MSLILEILDQTKKKFYLYHTDTFISFAMQLSNCIVTNYS
jgi:hypothetical protein